MPNYPVSTPAFRVDAADMEHFGRVLDALAPVGSVPKDTLIFIDSTIKGDGIAMHSRIGSRGHVSVVYPSETTGSLLSLRHEAFREAVTALPTQMPMSEGSAVRAVDFDTYARPMMVPVACEPERLGTYRPMPCAADCACEERLRHASLAERPDAVATMTRADFAFVARGALPMSRDLRRHVRLSVAGGVAEMVSWGEGGPAHGRADVRHSGPAFTVRMPARTLAGFLDVSGDDPVSLAWWEQAPYDVYMQCGPVTVCPVVSAESWDRAIRLEEPTAEQGQAS